MFRRIIASLLIIVIAVLALNINGQETPATSIIVNAWKAPPCTAYVNEDGLVYDAFYPTYAIVCRNIPEAINSEKRSADTDSTLFLMAGPQLNDSNLLKSIPTSARFAVDCHEEARGHWVQFTEGSGTNEHLFLLVDHTGGNCGERIRIYRQSASYNPPPPNDNACQNHTFRECYTRRCVNKPCLADVDGDGFPELLVLELVEWRSSRVISKYAYRVIKHVPKKGLRVVRELSLEEFEAIPDKRPL